MLGNSAEGQVFLGEKMQIWFTLPKILERIKLQRQLEHFELVWVDTDSRRGKKTKKSTEGELTMDTYQNNMKFRNYVSGRLRNR